MAGDQRERATIIKRLQDYRTVTSARNVLFRDALTAGLTVKEIAEHSGAALTTIYRALGRPDG
jgi:hypothetical protein